MRGRSTGDSGNGAPRVVLDDVTKSYDSTRRVLDGIDLVAEPGEFVVLLGASGSGKSTLLRCVAGTERVTGGSVSFDGLVVGDARRHRPPEHRDLAMVFQDYALWPHLPVVDNVGFALRRHGTPAGVRRTQALQMLDRVGLAALADRYPADLSGGEQQRVALARALVARPGLLLFDEPLSNLDTDLRDRLRVEIAGLARDSGATVLYITHDQAEAFALADRIGVLDAGVLAQHATPEEIYTSPVSPFVARFTGLAGELAGVCTGRLEAGRLAVRVGSDEVAARHAGGSIPGPGQLVRVLVRTAAVRLDRPGASDGPSVSEESGYRLAGVIRDVAFRGRGYDHVVEVDGGERLVGAFDQRRHERGAPVMVDLDPAGCLAFTEEQAVVRGPAAYAGCSR
ncbi:MAG: ABC transporter ATP-binding protein [Actinomycetes bacterium]